MLRSKKDFAGDVSALWHSALKRFTHNAFCFTPPIHWRNIDEIYPFLNRCLDGFDRFCRVVSPKCQRCHRLQG